MSEATTILITAIEEAQTAGIPWWVFWVWAFAFFGLAVNIFTGVLMLLKLAGKVVVLKKPRLPKRGSSDKKEVKDKVKEDPLDKLG